MSCKIPVLQIVNLLVIAGKAKELHHLPLLITASPSPPQFSLLSISSILQNLDISSLPSMLVAPHSTDAPKVLIFNGIK